MFGYILHTAKLFFKIRSCCQSINANSYAGYTPYEKQ